MNIENYVKLNENGEIEVDQKAFQSAFDAEISRAVEKNAKGKVRDEIRKELEDEAKLTAEQKLQAEREKFEEYKKSETIKLNQEKAKAKLEGKGFSEKEVEYLLANVGLDTEKSINTINTLIEEREKFVEATKKNAIESLQQQQNGSPKTLTNVDNNDKPQVVTRTTDEVLGFYAQKQTN